MARLVFHLPSLIGGGAERVWVLLANEMARRGHDTTLLVWNGAGPNAAHVSPAVRLVDFDIPLFAGERFGKPATLAGLWRTARLLRAHRPDAVFSAPEFANLLSALALYLAGSRAKFFPSFHAAAVLRDRRLGSQAARLLAGVMIGRATRAITVSQGIANDLSRGGIDRHRLVVIHNPLPPAATSPANATAWSENLAAARRANIAVIVTAGRLAPVKDHRTLIEAFALLLRRRPARLLILGDGPLRAELTALIADRGLQEHILMPGFVTGIAPALVSADLFALTSTSEGFGNVLVEAMAAGVPVVSTDCPHGPREILRDGALGALVPVGDPTAFAAAMARMLNHPTAPQQLRNRAADFSIERTGDQYETLLATTRS